MCLSSDTLTQAEDDAAKRDRQEKQRIKEEQVVDASLSLLHSACVANDFTRVQQLIEEGTDVNSIDKVITV